MKMKFNRLEGKIGMSTIEDLVDFVEGNGLDTYLVSYSLEGEQVAVFYFETYTIIVDMPLYENEQSAHLTTTKEGDSEECNQRTVKTWSAIENYFVKYGI